MFLPLAVSIVLLSSNCNFQSVPNFFVTMATKQRNQTNLHT